MTTIKHQDYTRHIIDSVRSVNPYKNDDGRIGYIYASGFLASYLANILSEDPIMFREFKQHIAAVKQRDSL